MQFVQNFIHWLDQYQQDHRWIAFPVAVIKRYGDDKAGRQAALITYYAFLSLFPLLLAFMTVLGIVTAGNAELRDQISSQVFQYFPDLGSQLKHSVGTLRGNGIALLLELLVLIYGARGFAAILQEAFNNVWHVEKEHRPGFVSDNLRSFGMMAAIAIGIIGGTALSYFLANVFHFGVIGSILLTILNLGVTYGLFLAVFRLGTSNTIALHWLGLGAFIAGTGVLIIQHFGSYIMTRELPKLSSSSGSFAFALGTMFWIYLQAQIILYALEITAVRTQHDWPKKLF